MTQFGEEGRPEAIIAKISQDTLAEMIGTRRSRESFFLNKFRKMGLIDYNDGVHVYRSVLTTSCTASPLITANFAVINSCHLSNFDQTGICLVG